MIPGFSEEPKDDRDAQDEWYDTYGEVDRGPTEMDWANEDD